MDGLPLQFELKMCHSPNSDYSSLESGPRFPHSFLRYNRDINPYSSIPTPCSLLSSLP